MFPHFAACCNAPKVTELTELEGSFNFRQIRDFRRIIARGGMQEIAFAAANP